MQLHISDQTVEVEAGAALVRFDIIQEATDITPLETAAASVETDATSLNEAVSEVQAAEATPTEAPVAPVEETPVETPVDPAAPTS